MARTQRDHAARQFAPADGHDRSTEPRIAATLAASLEAQGVDLPDDFDPVETHREIGRLQGRMEALRERARADPEIIDCVRLVAWMRTDRSRVTAWMDGRIECPDGWPEGVDGEAEVVRFVEEWLGDGAE